MTFIHMKVIFALNFFSKYDILKEYFYVEKWVIYDTSYNTRLHTTPDNQSSAPGTPPKA